MTETPAWRDWIIPKGEDPFGPMKKLEEAPHLLRELETSTLITTLSMIQTLPQLAGVTKSLGQARSDSVIDANLARFDKLIALVSAEIDRRLPIPRRPSQLRSNHPKRRTTSRLRS